MEEISWILKEPGPLLLIEKELFKKWEGTEGSSVSESKRSDYQRACAIRKAVTKLPVADHECLVFTKGRIVLVGWLPDASTGGVIVVSHDRFVPTDDELKNILAQARPKDWKDSKLDFEVDHLDWKLVSSVESETPVFGSLDVILDKGTYQIKTAHYEDDSWNLDFYKLDPKNVKGAGAARARWLDLRRMQQEQLEIHLAKVSKLLEGGDETLLLEGAEVLWTRSRWTQAMVASAVALAKNATANPLLQDLLLGVLDNQQLSDEQRSQLYPSKLQSWQRQMAGNRPVPIPVKTLDELIVWMIERGELVNERSNAIFSALETRPLGYSAFLKLFCVSDEVFPSFYGPRMLAWQVRNHKRTEDLRLLFRILLGLERVPSRSRSYYYPFYTIFLELKDVTDVSLPALDPSILASYFDSFAEAVAALADFLVKSEDLAVSDARVWWQELLASRKPEFAEKLRNLPDSGGYLIEALGKLLENPQLRTQTKINASLRAEISAALKEW